MKEALKLCAAELREARGEVEEVMHNCAAALAGTEKGASRVAEYRRQLARIDAVIAAAESTLAQPDPEPVAWQHRRPRCDDDGMLIGYSDWEDGRGLGNWPSRALYAGSAPAQAASPFAPCGRSAGTCGISSQTCGRDGCEADVVPADKLTKSQPLDWSAPVVAGTEQLAAATAERDRLRAEVERLRSTPPDQREDLHCVVSDLTRECDQLRARVAEPEAAAQPPAAARAPLNREQVNQIMRDAGYSPAPAQARADFINGLRWGERAHGIKAHPTP